MSPSYTYAKLDQKGVSGHIFHPTSVSPPPPPAGAEDIHIKVGEGATIHLRIFPSGKSEAPCLLFFHGNGEIVADYDEVGATHNKGEITFMAAEYRGYGFSTGTPTASNMMADSHAVLEAVCSWRQAKGYKGKLLVMGRSLGCAPAIELAWAHPDLIDALLIDSGFALTLPILQTLGIDVDGLGLTEEDGFHNLDKIKSISMPTYIIHGQNDEIITLTNATELIAESIAHQKEFQTVPGAGHNTIMSVAGPLYYEVMGRFIKTIGKGRKKKRGVR